MLPIFLYKEENMEKPEYFVVNPSTKLFGGVIVTKDTEFETQTEDGTIKQKVKDLTLTTTVKKESEYGDYKNTEEGTTTTTMPEGTILIWGEDTGYIIPNYHMVKVEDAIASLETLLDVTKPIEKGKEDESKGE